MTTPSVSREQADNTITVTGCGDCPMYQILPNGYKICTHLDNPIAGIIPFATCPLKTNSLTIQLKQDEQENI
jgi:hypothetical protein